MNKRRKKIVKWLLIFYAGAALVPYIIVPLFSQNKPEASVPEFVACDGERATILTTGQEAFDARMNMIANAEHSLIVGTFIFADDDTGSCIASALQAAADRGVHVRILIDGLSGKNALFFSNLGYALASHENIDIRAYNPPNLLKPWALNVRYHEKYMIADGQTLVLGGRNISDDFLSSEGHPRYNYDMDVLVYSDEPYTNQVAAALTDYFDLIWEHESKPTYTHIPFYRRNATEALQMCYKQDYDDFCIRYPEKLERCYWAERTFPIESYALMANPIEATATAPELWDSLAALMHHADERVWIQTPYLVLDHRMWNDLADLANPSIDDRIITNSKAGGNNIVASADMLFRKGTLIRTGSNLWTFQGPASMHTKTMLIDHDISVFGSFNFDMRSAYIDTEVMLMVQGESVNQLLEEHMRDMYAQSLPMDHSVPVSEDAIQPKHIC